MKVIGNSYLPSIVLTDLYERLRRPTLSSRCNNASLNHKGLALLMTHGLSAWMRAVSECSKTFRDLCGPAREIHPQGDAGTPIPLQNELTSIVAEMIINQYAGAMT
jgi:hypothetical protein